MSNLDPAMSSDFFVEGNKDVKDNTIPRFYVRAVKNEFRSQTEGRPIFEDREYVEILVPGNRGTVVDRAVKEEDRYRWPRQYQAFKQQQEEVLEGTPIEEWAAITRSQAEELKHVHVRTVEVLASLTDEQLAKAVPMGGHGLREKAQRFVEQAAGGAPAEALAAKLEEQATIMASMEAQVGELTRRLEEALNSKERG